MTHNTPNRVAEGSVGTLCFMARRKPEEWIWQVGTELQRIGDEMIRLGPSMISRKLWEPRADVLETVDAVMVRCEVAGMRGDDLLVTFNPDRNVLVIRGHRREEEPSVDEPSACRQLEIYYGEFEREVQMPEVDLALDQTRASYRNGMLSVIIPKKVVVIERRTVVTRHTE